MTVSRLLIWLCLSVALAGCQSVSFGGSAAPPFRQASWRCSDGVSLTTRYEGATMSVGDSRGFNPRLPASPPGQTTRYAEGIYALIVEGRGATWFVSGQKPVECRR